MKTFPAILVHWIERKFSGSENDSLRRRVKTLTNMY